MATEAWSIVRDVYVDPTLNHQDADAALTTAIASIRSAPDTSKAFKDAQDLLKTLSDPYTRLVAPKDYDDFRVSNAGALEGVGMVLANDPNSNRLVVLNPIEGGPAARAGILAGDEILGIDDIPVGGLSSEEAARRLRGSSGTTGAASGSDVRVTQDLQMIREPISLSPVLATALPSHVGYVRLSSFTKNAPEELARALKNMREAGADRFILDLRNNPGGLVKSGLAIASLFLPADDVVLHAVDRDGHARAVTAVRSENNYVPMSMDGAAANRKDSRNAVHEDAPVSEQLVVLVNGGSASASEILAAALQDHHRAVLLGEKTFGKGKIQNIFELSDSGSALFVTIAMYTSPDHHQIDKVGIQPNIMCTPEAKTAPAKPRSPDPISMIALLESDECVRAAEHQLGVDL
eukprot:jgi/Chlat1/5709/Chrsp38S05523